MIAERRITAADPESPNATRGRDARGTGALLAAALGAPGVLVLLGALAGSQGGRVAPAGLLVLFPLGLALGVAAASVARGAWPDDPEPDGVASASWTLAALAGIAVPLLVWHLWVRAAGGRPAGATAALPLLQSGGAWAVALVAAVIFGAVMRAAGRAPEPRRQPREVAAIARVARLGALAAMLALTAGVTARVAPRAETREQLERDLPALAADAARRPRGGREQLEYGLALVWLERYARAERPLARATRLRPDDVDAQWGYGSALMQLGEYARAVPPLQAAARLAPQNARVWHGLGWSLHSTRKHAEAEAAYRKAVSLYPDDANAMGELALCQFTQDRTGDAIATLQRAAALYPDLGWVRGTLGRLLRIAGKSDEARTALNAAARLDPKDAQSWAELAVLDYLAGDYDGALRSFARAEAAFPEFFAYSGVYRTAFEGAKARRPPAAGELFF